MKAVHFLALLCLIVAVQGVDRSKFKTCEQSTFCRRNRVLSSTGDQATKKAPDFQVVPESIRVAVDSFSVELDAGENRFLTLDVTGYESGALRVRFREKNAPHPRYEVGLSLVPQTPAKIVYKPKKRTISVGKESELVLQFHPFELQFVNRFGKTVLVLNQRHLMNWEFFKTKPAELTNDLDGEWSENFQSHEDRKPRGPTAVGMDVSFVGVNHVFGIPSHATNFSLPSTRGAVKRYDDPYRLYNLDVFEYEIDNPMALYCHVPVMVGHSKEHTTGFFWMNAAETWIDVDKTTLPGSVATHWISESGIIDAFLLPGPTPHDVLYQYGLLTGRVQLPPRFAIGYHQCKWNYKSEQEVSELDANFDLHRIPYDVVWLDIEHTNGKRYMTWDNVHFPTPKRMIDEIAAKGRKMVTIVDPHLKRDHDYSVHSSASKGGHYIKDRNGNEYDGWCWPGSSSWPDFLAQSVRDWWASLFSYDVYQHSTPSLFTWNDMNEPSVFNGPEVTMHKDAIHLDGFEHRDVHNLYGMAFHQATEAGQVLRNAGKQAKRTFVLSRAGFAGTQRFGAIWTGDNAADWTHLRAAQPMLLSLGIAGIPFVGADVGGFFGNPDGEMMARWNQAAAFHPFFRGHAHLDSKRREPYIYDEPYRSIMRNAIRTRYALLPYVYLQFYESQSSGVPVMRPVWMEFPGDENAFDLDDEFLLGPDVLVAPVTAAGKTEVAAYLPPQGAPWYRFDTLEAAKATGFIVEPAPLERIPAWIRGGSVIFKQERVRRSSSQMQNDPFTLVVSLNSQQQAFGKLYWDDGESMDYKTSDAYAVTTVKFANGALSGHSVHSWPGFKNVVERVIITGLAKAPTSVSGGYEWSFSQGVLTIRKPLLSLQQNWEIKID